jgi:DNA-binding NarL/FixJ family response regulator
MPDEAAWMTERQAPLPVVRVVIIEDQRETREGLRFLIDTTEGYRCVAAYETMEQALAGLRPELTDIALIDLGLPGLSGIQGIREIKARAPTLPLVALTIYEDDARIFEALCAGATGYLLKKTPPARLLECLREVMSGGAPISPEVAGRVIALFQKIRPPEEADYHLTPHELRLLKMLSEGHSYKSAAATLRSSVNTVKFHTRSIYAKLQVHSKSEAVAKALRTGLVD